MRLIFLVLTFLILPDTHALMNGAAMVNAPDVVRIKFKNGWVCSGVYIDPKTILTAAHCISASDSVQSSEVERIETEQDAAVDVQVTAHIPHPKYAGQFWPAYDSGARYRFDD